MIEPQSGCLDGAIREEDDVSRIGLPSQLAGLSNQLRVSERERERVNASGVPVQQ